MAHIPKNSPATADSLIAEIGVSQEILEQCRSFLPNVQHPPMSGEFAIADAEASAISLVRYTEILLKHATNLQDGLRGQSVTISGSGKLAIATAFRLLEFGAKVVSLSDRNGSITCPAGFTIDQVDAVKLGKSNRASLASIMRPTLATGNMTYHPRESPWQHIQRATIALPCAMEEEIQLADAEVLARRGVEYVLEGSTMSCSQAAVERFERPPSQGLPQVWYAPSQWNSKPSTTQLPNLTGTGKITTAASIDARISQENRHERNPHDWHKHQWIQRIEEAADASASNVITSLREYTEGFDLRTPDFNIGSTVLGVTRLARAMQEHQLYWSQASHCLEERGIAQKEAGLGSECSSDINT